MADENGTVAQPLEPAQAKAQARRKRDADLLAPDLSYISPDQEAEMWRFLVRSVQRIPSGIPHKLISEYVEERRVLPNSSPFPGRWRNSRTPYLVEIMDNMSIRSDVQQQAVMKGAQIGLTAAAENVCLYWMDLVPTKIMYMSATQDLLKKWMVTRLDPAIDSVGMRHKIAQQGRTNGHMGKDRRSGDTIYQKEFVGGALTLASANSAPSMRSDSVRILIRDEVDGAPGQLATGEGSWVDVSFARTRAYGNRRKVMDFSTPGTDETSVIKKRFERGDKRYFFVQCPYCKKYMALTFGSEQASHGMRGESQAGELVDVYYLCEYCREPIRDHQKQVLLETGYWEPSTRAQEKNFRSYHISSLYSPAGMMSFVDIWREYLKSIDDPLDGPRVFQTLTLGEPYKEQGQKPEVNDVIELRNTSYQAGEVPDGVLFLTCGIDVQRGSSSKDEAKREANPARLELEVCGHGAGFKTWSIFYRRFEGPVSDTSGGAWAALAEFVAAGGFEFYRRVDRRPFPVQLTLVDSGDGELTSVVYEFCATWDNTFPSKGYQWIRRAKSNAASLDYDDVMDALNARKYKRSSVGTSQIVLFTISTNYYKNHTYRNLNATKRRLGNDDEWQNAGATQFPRDYSDEYFKMLTAESKKIDGSFTCGNGVRNEALDCRVLNLCACDIYLDNLVLKLRDEAKRRKAKAHQVEAIRHKQVLEYLDSQVSRKLPD
jgi:phage terminase large subunit GpA-like protein